jgi:PIN domain nuclease of toxin-antitoxin system
MRLLLDTHVFLWFISGDPRLNVAHRDAIRDPANTVQLSVVSLWEAAVKYAIGRLPLPVEPTLYLPAQRERHGILSLALDEPSVAELANLPTVHRDPFDRMLICQARHHALKIVSADSTFANYPVDLLAAR